MVSDEEDSGVTEGIGNESLQVLVLKGKRNKRQFPFLFTIRRGDIP